MPSSTLLRLKTLFNDCCHYCGDKTNSTSQHPKQATKDHVVPRAFGGRDSIANYVLACAQCNNARGTMLFYCSCSMCSVLIREALLNSEFINTVFDGILAHNKPRVKRVHGKWIARRGHVNRQFDTHAQALKYALTGNFMKGS